MKLVQKQLFKGRREFEIVDDSVEVRIGSALRTEKSTVSLATLNPDPVDNGEFVEFHSRVRGGPMLSLLRERPNASVFNGFVDELRRRAREEYHRFAGLRGGPDSVPAVDEQQAEIPDYTYRRPAKPVNPERVDEAIRLLRQFVDSDEIETLLAALEALKAEPEAESRKARLVQVFDELGPSQGAVLTYAPYVGVLLSADPFSE